MVVLDDIKEKFFNNILHKRIVVFVSTDVDGVCAWKILQILLKNKHVRYTVIPVENKEQLSSAYKENFEDVSSFIFINCGANFDLVEFMELGDSDEITFYICDNHRPVNVNNFYNQTQVKLLTHDEDFDTIPSFDDLFRDDESEDESNDEDGPSKRRRFDEAHLERRIERKNWARKRQELLLEYEECSFRTTSAALIFFDLAWKISQDSTELLWLAIVGHTSLFVTHSVNREHYMDSIDYLQNQVARLARSGGRLLNSDEDESTNIRPLASLRISFEEEVLLSLHRHWSLREAMENSLITSTRFKLFMVKGQKKLQEFLAHAGLPQKECEQKFSSMDVKLRSNLPNLFAEHGEKFGLERRDMFLPSFVTYNGFWTRLSAIDAAQICVAVLENSQGGVNVASNFRDTCDILTNPEVVDGGLLQAQRLLRYLTQQVQQFLDTDEINVFRAFLYVHVGANSLISPCLSRPLSMSMLARLALNAKAAIRPNLGRNKRTHKLPLLLCIDSPGEQSDTVTVMGVPPLQGDDDRNVFGQAFESAAQTTKSKVQFSYFDTHIMAVKRDDLLKLFEALASLLS